MKIVLFLLLLFAIFVISLCVGSDGLNFSDLFAFSNDDLNGKIMREIRLPHTLAALICGAALALSGAAMQSIFKNALASPYTLGISNAGAFGASFYIIFLQEIPFLSIEISAFISAFSCICVMMFLARFLAMASLVLFGIGLGAFFGAGVMFLQFFADDTDIATTLFWTFGDISKATFSANLNIFAIFVIATVIFSLNYWKFDALHFGDDKAQTLGVNVKFFQILVLFWATLLSTLCVCYFGIIGFIGLVAPHIIKFSLGFSHKILFIFSGLCGAIMLGAADILSRLIFAPVILPVGILTAFLGVPLLLFLLIRKI